jgi:acyl-coenzyme A thioesterase PaaI-like protein
LGADLLARVLRAIARNRTPGFNQPGYFLDISYDRVSRDGASASLQADEASSDAQGNLGIGPLALLADMTLASSLRAHVGASARMATVSMSLQFTGAAPRGRVSATSNFDGFVEDGAERQGLTRVEIHSGKKLVCTGSGAFMVLGKPNATAPHPLPRRGARIEVPRLGVEDLNSDEEGVYRHAARAARMPGAFIESFWGYRPHAIKGGAKCTVWNGPHIGNRVGHAQGGVTFGLACATAAAALPGNWALVAASAWYVGPGTGEQLKVRSKIVHQGQLTAVVESVIANGEGRPVLRCVTSHARKMVEK